MDSSSNAWSADTSIAGIRREARMAIHESLGFLASTPILVTVTDGSMMSLAALTKIARRIRWQIQDFAIGTICTDPATAKLNPLLRSPELQSFLLSVEPSSGLTQWLLGADLLLLFSNSPMLDRIQVYADSANVSLILVSQSALTDTAGVESASYQIVERLERRKQAHRPNLLNPHALAVIEESAKLDALWQSLSSQSKVSEHYEPTTRVA